MEENLKNGLRVSIILLVLSLSLLIVGLSGTKYLSAKRELDTFASVDFYDYELITKDETITFLAKDQCLANSLKGLKTAVAEAAKSAGLSMAEGAMSDQDLCFLPSSFLTQEILDQQATLRMYRQALTDYSEYPRQVYVPKLDDVTMQATSTLELAKSDAHLINIASVKVSMPPIDNGSDYMWLDLNLTDSSGFSLPSPHSLGVGYDVVNAATSSSLLGWFQTSHAEKLRVLFPNEEAGWLPKLSLVWDEVNTMVTVR